ncbi:MAG TPA: NAD+ synthase, partial [Phycisphaeraceae bacterium]|nr:NAD+ synthase [Phycisphaeraceae bacterium]
MRIALAQINPTIGDLQGNTEIILRDIEKAKQNNADLVVFPELAIPGYPPKDLLLREGFVEQCLTCAELIASECQGIAAAVGLPTRSQTKPGTETKGGAQRCTFRGLHNSLAFCTEGKIARLYHKRLLPTYDVFDEDRYFDPGNEVVVIEL